MGDDDDDAAPGAHPVHRRGQRRLALVVEVGVGLVEHHQEGIAVERARQPDALALPARKRQAALADPRLVALGHLHDHLVHAGGRRRGHHRRRILGRGEARDRLGDGRIHQADVLRQVADMAAEVAGAPLGQVRPVEAHRPAQHRQHPGQRLDQRGLAAARGADDADRLAGSELEGHVGQQHPARPGGGHGDGIRPQGPGRGRQLHRLGCRGQRHHRLLQAGEGGAGGDDLLPVADRRVDRGQRAGGGDGGGDDRPGGEVAPDREEGAEAQQRRLQDHPQHARDRAEGAGDVVGPGVQVEVVAVGLGEAGDGAVGEAHRLDDVGVAGIGLGDGVALDRGGLGGLGQAAGQKLRRHGQQRQHHHAAERQRAQERMQQVDEDQEDRHPGDVEDRGGPLAAHEAAHRVHVAAALHRLGGGIAEAGHVDDDLVGERRDLPVEPAADPHQDLGAQDVEEALEEVEPDRQRREGEQGRDAAAAERAVVDLQHVDRPGEGEDVDDPRQSEDVEQHHPQAGGHRAGLAVADVVLGLGRAHVVVPPGRQIGAVVWCVGLVWQVAPDPWQGARRGAATTGRSRRWSGRGTP